MTAKKIFDFEGIDDAQKILALLETNAEWIGKNEAGLFITMSREEARSFEEGWYNEMARRLGWPSQQIKITHRDDFEMGKIKHEDE